MISINTQVFANTVISITEGRVSKSNLNKATDYKTLKVTGMFTVNSSIYNKDITSKFKDNDFKKYIYKLIKKSSSEPILYSDVNNIKILDINSMSISNLSGIEYFTALTTLRCRLNRLTSLDLSNNTKLTILDCFSNELTSLNVSKNTKITDLDCCNNQLKVLDINNNISLKSLNCVNNQLETLDVSKNAALSWLNCASNKLTTLDVSKSTTLSYLDCSNNQLTTLYVSKNKKLYYLHYLNYSNNKLTIIEQ